MRKFYLVILLLGFISLKGHAQTHEGTIMLEVGSTPFTFGQLPPSTSLQFLTRDGLTALSIGAEGGYFLADDVALKLGLGIQHVDFDNDILDSQTNLLYKLGVKYYAASVVPIQIDFTGLTIDDEEFIFGENENPDPFWLGIQGGYAIFISDNISFEPSLRYNISLNDEVTEDGVFEARFGFAIFFN